jgi:salicylate hydroxylase
MPKTRKVIIVGAGLGGLAATVGLRQRGFEVEVYEQAPELGEIGAGINITPNGAKVLNAFGLGDEARRFGNIAPELTMCDMKTDERLFGFAWSEFETRYGQPQYQFHRADLLGLLQRAVPESAIRLNARCVGVSTTDNSAAITLENGDQIEGDVVIGADGIHSRIRAALWDNENPVFTGQIAWRATLKGSDLPADILGQSGARAWMGPDHYCVSYFLRGRELINVVLRGKSDEWAEESWTAQDDPDAVRAKFAPHACDRLKALTAQIKTCNKFGLFGRKASDRWGKGRIQLLGDAAHPVLPNGGQGANGAFEDAFILAAWLDERRDDAAAALQSYESVRKPRATKVQGRSRENAKLHLASDPAEIERRQREGAALTAKGDTFNNMGWVFAYDPVTEWRNIPAG